MSISVVIARALIEAIDQAGLSRDGVLRAQLASGRLAEGGERLELEEFERLLSGMLELTRDEALGLRIAEHSSDAAFDVVGHLVPHAPTLREAIAVCSQFLRLLLDGANLTLEETRNTAIVLASFGRSTPVVDRVLAEVAVGGLMRMLRGFAGPHGRLHAAYFEHARPAYHAEYTRLFGEVVRFTHSFTGIEFARELLDRPHLHRHRELFAVLRSQADVALQRLTRGISYAERLTEHLLSKPPLPMPAMEDAARSLGISVRSLRRRLSEEGTTYRALVEAALKESATHMLRDPCRSVQETAHALGFSDPSAFHRAFKRWTGTTPKEYKEGTPSRFGGDRSEDSS